MNEQLPLFGAADPIPAEPDNRPDPALGISTEIVVNENRKMVFQTHLSQRASRLEINAIVDKINAVADRQKDQYDLTLQVHEQDKAKHLVEDAKRRFGETQQQQVQEWERKAGEGRRFKPTPAQENQLKQLQEEIRKGEVLIEWQEKRIAELRRRIKEDLY